jgi:hypothetical protein
VRADPGHKRLVIQDEYHSLVDEVAAREMPRYTANLAKARGQLGYSLSWSDGLPPPVAAASIVAAGWIDRLNWPVLLLAAFSLALYARIARRAWRYDPEPAPVAQREASLAGIGGWLLLYTAIIAVLPLQIALRLWESAPAYGSVAWSARTTFGHAHYHVLYAPVLSFELLGVLALLVYSLLLLRLYFARRSSFPRLALLYYAACVLFQGLDMLLSSRLPAHVSTLESWADLVRVLVAALLWGAYLRASRRVRSTFVRRLAAPPPLPLPAIAPAPAAL